jgi:hypothetical protein
MRLAAGGMRVRTGVLLAMWVLVLWGAHQALRGIGNDGLSSDVVCPGTNIGLDDEEHPDPMKPSDRCALRDEDGVRSYKEQWAVQRQAHRDVVIGVSLLGVGALGLSALSLQGRLKGRRAAR